MPSMKKTSKGLALMHKYAKAQVTPEKKIEWFRNRHIEHLGEIRLLKSRLKLALKKVAYLENKLQTKNNMKPTYQDLNLRMNEIFGTKKTRARATGGGTYCPICKQDICRSINKHGKGEKDDG